MKMQRRGVGAIAEQTSMAQHQARWQRLAADAENEYAKWLGTIPETFDARQGAAAAVSALRWTRAMVRDIAWSMQGSQPPPPWPAHPELVMSRKRMQTMLDGFEAIERRAPATKWKRDGGPGSAPNDKIGPLLKEAGRRLYVQTAAMLRAAAVAPRLENFLPDVGKWFVGLGLLWLGRRQIAKLLTPRPSRQRRYA